MLKSRWDSQVTPQNRRTYRFDMGLAPLNTLSAFSRGNLPPHPIPEYYRVVISEASANHYPTYHYQAIPSNRRNSGQILDLKPILYTITAYIPSIGGAQLHLHEFARHMALTRPIATIYQWDENRTDWLLGTTLNGPTASQPGPIDHVARYRLALTPDQRAALRFWVRFYRVVQGPAIEHIAEAFLTQLKRLTADALAFPPEIVHNSRVGREGLSVASWKLAQHLHVPFVLTPNHHPRWKGWLYRHFIRLYQRADALIAYSDFEAEELVRLGVPTANIHRLGIGPILAPSANGAHFRQRFGIGPEAPLVLFLGQKYPYKGIDQLLKAIPNVWARFPETWFAFVGPRTAYSTRLFEAAGTHARIIELDAVDLQTKTDALAACDVLCVPSSQESFGGVFVEAGQLGKPVIGGSAPAIREVIEDGNSGFIVNADPDMLANRLVQLIADPAMRTAFGNRGLMRAQTYQWASLSAHLADIYASLR